jgi:hypothetical protein
MQRVLGKPHTNLPTSPLKRGLKALWCAPWLKASAISKRKSLLFLVGKDKLQNPTILQPVSEKRFGRFERLERLNRSWAGRSVTAARCAG